MTLRIELEQEDDGRWIAEVLELPGAMVYGTAREGTEIRAKALALRTIAEHLGHGEVGSDLTDIVFMVC